MNYLNKILIIGQGQLGKEIKNIFQTYNPICLTRQHLDLSQTQSIITNLNNYSPSIIINTAAYTAVDKAEQQPNLALCINSNAIEKIAFFCKQKDIPLIHYSTDYVYDGKATKAYTEENIISPLNIYGITKASGDKKALAINSKTIILRTSWLYSHYEKNFVTTMINLAQKKDTLSIISDQIGSPTSTYDLAQATKKIIQQLQINPIYGIFHCAGTNQTNWYKFASTIFNEYNKLNNSFKIPKLIPITTTNYPTPAAKRPLYSVLNKNKLKKAYKITCPIWQKSLKRVLNKIIYKKIL